MILSHQHRFIFIKTMKTAGTSIEVYLSRFCGPDDIVTPIMPQVPPHHPRNHEGYYNHMPAREVAARQPRAWAEYFKFCVERNPWDKALSHYFMLKNSPNHRTCDDLSLDAYLSGDGFPHNHHLYTDESGQLLVDRVLRYEHLATDLAEVLGQLGIPFAGELGVRAKSEWRTDRRHYRDVLSPTQARRVASVFAREIALHGYQY